jgi:uncharacterized protein YgiM (DUF1202 family)
MKQNNIIGVIAVLFIIFIFMPVSLFAENQKYKVLCNLNFRDDMSMDSSVIKVLKEGEIVTEIEAKGSWVYIQDKFDHKGYVVLKYLEPVVSSKCNKSRDFLLPIILLTLIIMIISIFKSHKEKSKKNNRQEIIYIYL